MNDYPLTREFLKRHPGLLLDQNNFLLVEEALGGDWEAMDRVVSNLTSSAPGFSFHYSATMELAHRFYKLDQEHNDPDVILNDLNNFVVITSQAEDWEETRKWQIKTIQHMVSNFAPEEWNFQHFENMAAILEMELDIDSKAD